MQCVASVSDGSAFTITRLKSATTDGQRIVDTTVSYQIPAGTGYAWRGAALTSSSVEVVAQLGTKIDTASDAFTVESRIGRRQDWMSKSFPDIGFSATPPLADYVLYRPLSQPYPGFGPTRADRGALGRTLFFYPSAPAFGRPRGGPNAGITFVRYLPWNSEDTTGVAPGIYLARSLSPIDAFYQLQNGTGAANDPYCTPQEMADIANYALSHENLHWTHARSRLEPLAIQDSLEKAIVLPGRPTTPLDAVWDWVRRSYAATVTAANSEVHATPDPDLPCQLRRP